MAGICHIVLGLGVSLASYLGSALLGLPGRLVEVKSCFDFNRSADSYSDEQKTAVKYCRWALIFSAVLEAFLSFVETPVARQELRTKP
jgi:hypothetical protein